MHRIPRSYNVDLPKSEEGNRSICEGRDYGENESDYRRRGPL